MAERQIVQVEVDEADAELAADALWQGRPTAVSEGSVGGGRVRLTADVADLAGVGTRWPVQLVEPDSDAHLDAWRAWATPQRVGERLVLQPAWLPEAGVGADDLVIRLDPGRAFGSGSHVSTRLVLAVLEGVLDGGERVLDVGCGSGVLAVAACRLGAASAVAVDVDPAAVEATRANAAANGVADLVDVSRMPVREVDAEFDVVLANIGLAVLRELASDLVARVRPGGLLVLAGLLDHQADEVVAACTGTEELSRPTDDGWSAPVLRRSERGL